MKQVILISDIDVGDFEANINSVLHEIEDDGESLIDIKLSETAASRDYDGGYTALILYEAKKNLT